ncbi:conserved hypothetical protein [Ricinus communis]|uniref:Uncharacterized protein n=1 Tax=Ricinus communis TaxID=3988 RepID=B9TC66_RICCO|nr:conserved hypothetical protein [Ricinus communis]
MDRRASGWAMRPRRMRGAVACSAWVRSTIFSTMDRLRATTAGVPAIGGAAGGIRTGEGRGEALDDPARELGFRHRFALFQQALQHPLDVPDEFRIARIRRMQAEAHERRARQHGRRGIRDARRQDAPAAVACRVHE